MQLYLPVSSSGRQIILQKLSTDLSQGFTLHLEPSSTSFVQGVFSVTSGSVQNDVTAQLEKGRFNHIAVILNRETGLDSLQFFVNESLQNESKKEKNIGIFTETPNLLIGSGSSFYVTGTLISPEQTLSGSMDEFRIFHSYRTISQQQAYATKGMYATDSLKLYYRFNEPSSSLSSVSSDSVNSIILDSSGNALHSLINNFSTTLRQSAKDDTLNPVKNERPEFKTILFPYNPDIISLNADLLTTASIYDQENPNLITKLIPRHYLREGAFEEGFANTDVEGSIGDSYTGQGIPGQGTLGSAQVMLTFLYIWAKFFDEIKMFVDAFKTLRTVDYTTPDTIPNNFLNDFVRFYGMYLPPMFNSSNIQQYVEGEDINEIGINDVAIKQVQADLLRRVLTNMPDVLRSKGTQHSVRSFLKSLGIDPDNSLRIREFGGPSLRQFGTCREVRTEPVATVNFHTASLVSTPFLSASRSEPGYPEPIGPLSSGISTNANDGLLTSGSWSFEGTYKFIPTDLILAPQSLARFEVTGSAATTKPGVVANLMFSGSELHAFFRPGMATTSPTLDLMLPLSLYDGNRWSISFGCYRNDSIGSEVSSSYFLRAATQNAGDITEIFVTSSFFDETPAGEKNAFRELDATYNASGSKLSIGNDPNLPAGAIGYRYLNSTLDASDIARASNFVGHVSSVRFWSKGLTEEEWKEHVRNCKSFGVDDPLTNYNYVTNKSGSFEKLRLDIFEKQAVVTASVAGNIQFLDFSENLFHANGTGFPVSGKTITGDLVSYSYISPYFDEYSSSEKIRIRGFKDEESLVDTPWATIAPVYEIPPGETPLDDPRFSIEFSLIDTLNRDIIGMFASLDEMANAIASPELAFSPDYPSLENLRNVYFNRLSEKLNFRSFFEFYKWFDTSISTFIEQLVPRKTKFKGTNFIVESHMLERHKIEYKSSEIYLGDSSRLRIRDNLANSQLNGNIK